jgi:hypothetical protein
MQVQQFEEYKPQHQGDKMKGDGTLEKRFFFPGVKTGLTYESIDAWKAARADGATVTDLTDSSEFLLGGPASVFLVNAEGVPGEYFALKALPIVDSE